MAAPLDSFTDSHKTKVLLEKRTNPVGSPLVPLTVAISAADQFGTRRRARGQVDRWGGLHHVADRSGSRRVHGASPIAGPDLMGSTVTLFVVVVQPATAA